MTTIVGIKAYKDKESIILASDTDITQDRWSSQGDILYKNQTRFEAKKIYVDDKREFAVAMSGIFDQLYANFLSSLLKGEFDIRGVTKKGFFEKLVALNEMRWGDKLPNDSMNELLIATRFDKPKLYHCFPLGKVEEMNWVSIGSGSNYVIDYIFKKTR